MLLKGKNVFLTGGSRGIGKYAIYELVKNGANVAFTYISSEEGAKETVNEALKINPEAKLTYYKMDVKNSKEVDAVAEKAIKDMAGIHVVVNNAGILRDGPIHYMSNEQWDEVIQTHLTGTFYVCRAFIEEFIYNKGGNFDQYFIDLSCGFCRTGKLFSGKSRNNRIFQSFGKGIRSQGYLLQCNSSGIF